MRHQPKHARRRRRGNEVTPLLHALALVAAWPMTLVTMQTLTSGMLAHLGTPLVTIIALGIFAVYEIVFAFVIAFVCVVTERYEERRIQRILDRR